MVKGHRKEKHSRNILKKIEKGFGGPIDMLKVYMEEKKRVKVCIQLNLSMKVLLELIYIVDIYKKGTRNTGLHYWFHRIV